MACARFATFLGALLLSTVVVGRVNTAVGQDVAKLATQVTAVDLPFVAARLAVSADGARAVVWDAIRNRQQSQRLAVIDLELGKVVAQTTWPRPLSAVAVGAHVYVSDAEGIARLSADRLEKEAAIEARSSSNLLHLVANRRLSRGPRERRSLPDLALIDNYDHDINSPEGWLDGRCGFGWFSEGVLWDEALQQPLLLAWPYELQRVPWQNVLRKSLRGPGEFQPFVGTWHPFSVIPAKNPVEVSLAIAHAPDIAATLAIINDSDGFVLGSFRLDTGKRIAAVPLLSSSVEAADARRSAKAIATGGDRFAVLLFNRVYSGSLQPLRNSEAPPFHIEPRQSVLLLDSDKPTTVRYTAAGAARFRLTSRSLGQNGKPLEIESQTGEFELSVAESVDSLLNYAAGLAANLNKGRRVANNHLRAELYAAPSRAAFRRMLGRDPVGIPLPIDVRITAEGADFETAVLRHDFLVDVPLQRLEDALDSKYPYARDPWKKPDKQFSLTDYPPDAAPPSGETSWLKHLRQLWEEPKPEDSVESLREAAANAKAAGDQRLRERFVQWLAERQWRTWTDGEGRSVEAQLVQYFAGQVTLKTRQGNEVSFKDKLLSEADRAFLKESEPPPTPNDSGAWREFLVAETLRATALFDSSYSILPPRALADDSGQPRLSWRVFLLRELGYGELFALIRFDEPWNSPHNKELIPLMPDCYAVDVEQAAAGKTTLMTVGSHLSALQPNGKWSRRKFGPEAAWTVVFVEAADSRAAEWTKPVDLPLHEFAEPSSVVRVRDERTLVGLLNGNVIRIGADTSPDDWRYAVNLGDSRRLFTDIKR